MQVHIPLKRSSQSFVTKMRCQVTSRTTHGILISQEISYKTYKEICSGEPKKVNLGYNNDYDMKRPKFSLMKVENNTLMPYPPHGTHLHGEISAVSYVWEILSKFLSIHNIEPNWLNCGFSWGWYSAELGGWTGCMGKV